MRKKQFGLICICGMVMFGIGCATSTSAAGDATSADDPIVVMDTTFGPVKIELFANKAPVTVKNFLSYVDDKFYDGTIFHRVISDFMIQGGGMTPGMKQKPTKAPIKNESANGLSNERGTLAMARTNDPNSATSQFFINVVDNPALDRANSADGFGYCVFGKVIDGMKVVDQIRSVKLQPWGDHVPLHDVVITSIRRADR